MTVERRLRSSEARLPPWMLARARAQIALHLGDIEAAKAILIMAIETDPEAPGLRPLMTEALMATGGAAYAREVLRWLGQPPVNPRPEPVDDAAPEEDGSGSRKKA